MHENHIENGYVAKSMLKPELIVTVSCGTGVGDNRRSDESKYRAREEPEISYIKKGLRFSNYKIGAEDNAPAANCNGQVINGVCAKGGNAYKTPKIRHFANYHCKGENKANCLFILKIPDDVSEFVDKYDCSYHKENG